MLKKGSTCIALGYAAVFLNLLVGQLLLKNLQIFCSLATLQLKDREFIGNAFMLQNSA